MGPVVRTSARVGAVVHILSPTAGLYILMPESRFGHNNTIGLMGDFRRLGRCQRSAILRLTPRIHAHISAAPTANGAYQKRCAYLQRGSSRPKWHPSRPRVSTGGSVRRSCALCIVG